MVVTDQKCRFDNVVTGLRLAVTATSNKHAGGNVLSVYRPSIGFKQLDGLFDLLFES